MDLNKLNKLHAIQYRVLRVCGLCKHSTFKDAWGSCSVHEYEHLKHTDQRRHLSVHQFGSCSSFEEANVTALGTFTEFLESTPAASASGSGT